jgi:hypothetical protein
LSRSVLGGSGLSRAVLDGVEAVGERFEREMSRLDPPSIELVRPDFELLAQLPAGMADRLGVVPVRRDPRLGRVDVAVLAPLDEHVHAELEFQLDAKVRLLRADPNVLRAALASGGSPRAPSGPPLPLVRRAPASELGRATVTSLSEGSPSPESEPLEDADVSAAPPPSVPPREEPVLSLARAKPAPPTASAPSLPLAEARATFERTRTPDDVVAAILLGLAPSRAVVLAVRANAYVGRAGSSELSQVAVRKLEISASVPSVLQTASRSGFYLGALPHTPAHEALRALFDNGDDEVYVAGVKASSHTVLAIVCEPAPLGGSVDATRRIDALATAAGQALERIVVSRKRGN